MDLKKAFYEVMENTVNMALATSVDNAPNVRVVTFAYDKEKGGKVFFTSFKECEKVKELEKNPRIACVPLPENPDVETQVRIFGEAKLSNISLEEVIEIIDQKYPDGATTIKSGGPMMNIYEVNFSKAYVTIGVNAPEEIHF